MAGDWARMSVAAARDRRPIWMVPQVFNWGTYNTDTKSRPPTLPEMRSMAWQCIVEGAKGLIFYSWFDIRKDTVVPFAEQWPLVKKMAGEIKDLEPVILSMDCVPEFRAVKRPWLHWMVRVYRGETYLIAVNDEGKGHQVTFNLGKEPKGLATRGEDHLHGVGLLGCEFAPFEVKVYRMRF
jgi:hypothetical protein